MPHPAHVRRSIVTSLRLLRLRSFSLRPATTPLSIVVFSKDRPLQLHALLASLQQRVTGQYQVSVVWHCSSSEFGAGYQRLIDMPWPETFAFTAQRDFKSDLVQELSRTNADAVMFLVDDIIFVGDFFVDWLDAIDLRKCVPSIRLDEGINYSQTHTAPCPPPTLLCDPKTPQWQGFDWTEGEYYWAMPLAVDGNIFARREILLLAKSTDYKAPNSFEAALGPYRFLFKHREGKCLKERAITNLALNRVQVENLDFPCGEVSPQELLARWNAGYVLDIKSMSERLANACHFTAEPVLVKQ